MILLQAASGAVTGRSKELSSKGFSKGKSTLFVKADSWGAAAFSIEVSPDGTTWYSTTIGGNATVTADTAAELDLNANFIRGIVTTGHSNIVASLVSYGG